MTNQYFCGDICSDFGVVEGFKVHSDKLMAPIAQWLGCWTLEQKVWGSILTSVMSNVPLDKVPHSHMSLFTLEYKLVTSTNDW